MKIFKGWNKLVKIIDTILQKSFSTCNLLSLEVSKNIADVDDEYEFFGMKFHVHLWLSKQHLYNFILR